MNLRDKRDHDPRLWYPSHSLRSRWARTNYGGLGAIHSAGLQSSGYPRNHNLLKSPEERQQIWESSMRLASGRSH